MPPGEVAVAWRGEAEARRSGLELPSALCSVPSPTAGHDDDGCGAAMELAASHGDAGRRQAHWAAARARQDGEEAHGGPMGASAELGVTAAGADGGAAVDPAPRCLVQSERGAR